MKILEERNGLIPIAGQGVNDWMWSQPANCPMEVKLSSNRRAAYFHTDPVNGSLGTAGVKGTKGFVDGEHYWEIQFLEPLQGTSVMVGVVTKDARLCSDDCSYINLLGHDNNGWGLNYKGHVWHGGKSTSYCDPFYQEYTVIGVHLNLYTGTLSFYKDGQYLGVAFRGLDKMGQALYPAVSSTSINTELEVTKSHSRYFTLQEKCFAAVAKQLRQTEDIQRLPLPLCFKRHLLEIRGHLDCTTAYAGYRPRSQGLPW